MMEWPSQRWTLVDNEFIALVCHNQEVNQAGEL